MAKRGRKKGDTGNCSVCGRAGHNKRSHRKSAEKPRTVAGLRRKLAVVNVRGQKGATQRTGKGSGRRGRPRKRSNVAKSRSNLASWFGSW